MDNEIFYDLGLCLKRTIPAICKSFSYEIENSGDEEKINHLKDVYSMLESLKDGICTIIDYHQKVIHEQHLKLLEIEDEENEEECMKHEIEIQKYLESKKSTEETNEDA